MHSDWSKTFDLLCRLTCTFIICYQALHYECKEKKNPSLIIKTLQVKLYFICFVKAVDLFLYGFTGLINPCGRTLTKIVNHPFRVSYAIEMIKILFFCMNYLGMQDDWH